MTTEVNTHVAYSIPIFAAENENKNLISTVEGEHSHNSEVE